MTVVITILGSEKKAAKGYHLFLVENCGFLSGFRVPVIGIGRLGRGW